MTMPIIVDTYIVSDPHDPQAGEFKCRCCGARQSWRLPMPVQEYVKLVSEFNAMHAICRPPSTPTITDMFTGKQRHLPRAAYSGEPTVAWIAGWDAGMDGDPESPPPCYSLPSEIADWRDGYEAADRD